MRKEVFIMESPLDQWMVLSSEGEDLGKRPSLPVGRLIPLRCEARRGVTEANNRLEGSGQ